MPAVRGWEAGRLKEGIGKQKDKNHCWNVQKKEKNICK
jgi:hypothetical protein